MVDDLSFLAQRIIDASLPLNDTAKNLVLGKGNPNASILIIGEAPGEKEDQKGIPFVGRAGKELDKLLASINLSLDEVYITNILKYRPPNNRNPTREEMLAHTPFLCEQIAYINPRIIITLGNFSTRFVLNDFSVDGLDKIDGISELHGTVVSFQAVFWSGLVLPLYHPAAMLYNPSLREVAYEDIALLPSLLED